MANTLKKVVGVATTTGATIATVPVGATWTIIGCRMSNKDTNPHVVDVKIAGTFVSGDNTQLPVGSAIDIMVGSKIVAEAGDTIVVTADANSAVDVYVSFLEQV